MKLHLCLYSTAPLLNEVKLQIYVTTRVYKSYNIAAIIITLLLYSKTGKRAYTAHTQYGTAKFKPAGRIC